jgi:Integrase core domain
LKSELQTKAQLSMQQGILVQTRMKFASLRAMQSLLETFRLSYNGYRPHQNLQGAPPA